MFSNCQIVTGSILITPRKKVALFGFGNRSSPFTRIAGELEINALILKSEGKELLFISADSLYISEDLFKCVEETFGLRFKAEQIFFGATHTHFAPALDQSKQRLGQIDNEYRDYVLAQTKLLLENIKSSDFKDVEAKSGSIDCVAGVYRRKATLSMSKKPPFFEKKTTLTPNLRKKIDQEISSLSFFDKTSGKLVAFIWNLACHPVAFPERHSVSSDFPGVVRDHIRSHFSSGASVLFFQGYSGDIRPAFWQRRYNLLALLCGKDRKFIIPTVNEYKEWSETVASRVSKTIESSVSCSIGPLSAKIATLPLKELIEETTSNNSLQIRVTSINRSLYFVGMSAEPSNDYTAILRPIFTNKRIFFCGCIGPTYGYLPTKKNIIEGGYEGLEFLRIFDVNGTFRHELEHTIFETVKRVAQGITER